jgi:hypothetical protein
VPSFFINVDLSSQRICSTTSNPQVNPQTLCRLASGKQRVQSGAHLQHNAQTHDNPRWRDEQQPENDEQGGKQGGFKKCDRRLCGPTICTNISSASNHRFVCRKRNPLAGATGRRFSRNRTRKCVPFLLFCEGHSSEPETSINSVVQSLLTLCADVKNYLGIRILITIVTTFVLISIIPIMLIDLLPSPEVALPLSNTSSGSDIVHRSFPLDSRSGNSTWNYAKLCEPREGKCQFGTYSTKHHPSNRTLLWLDKGCEERHFKAYCPRCPEEKTWVLDTAQLHDGEPTNSAYFMLIEHLLIRGSEQNGGIMGGNGVVVRVT